MTFDAKATDMTRPTARPIPRAVHGVLRERHALFAGLRDARSACSPGMRTGTPSRSGRRLEALAPEPHLRQEGLAPGEGIRARTAGRRCRPSASRCPCAEAGQALGERLDHRASQPLWPYSSRPAAGDCHAALSAPHARVLRRPPSASSSRGCSTPRRRRSSRAPWRPSRSTRRCDRRVCGSQDADGERFGCEQRLAPAIRGDEAEGGIGGGQDGDATAVRRLLHKRREASDVVAAAHREGDHAVRRDPSRAMPSACCTSQRPGRCCRPRPRRRHCPARIGARHAASSAPSRAARRERHSATPWVRRPSMSVTPAGEPRSAPSCAPTWPPPSRSLVK